MLTRNNELGELLENSRALIYQLISDDVVDFRKMAARSKLIPVSSELQAIAQDRLELAQKIQKLSEELYDE